ncbi:MAG TPA: aminopeptidase [Syntrophorhabdales bacterium]|nr:aminopeptidase [Syntrophorhabdales bacterium]
MKKACYESLRLATIEGDLMNTMYEKYAKLLVHYSLGLKKGDKLLINSTYLAEPLVKEVYREALNVGAHPEIQIAINELTRLFYDHARDAQLRYVSPMYLHAVKSYDAFLTIRAPFNLKELQSIDPEKKKEAAVAQTRVKKLFMKRASIGALKWTLCEFPTDSQAQECSLSRSEYEDLVFSACFLYSENPQGEWQKMRASQQHIVDFLNARRNVRIVGRDTDLSFTTGGRKWINSDGRHNMPSGEVFTSPEEDSVQGRVTFSFPGIYMGQEIEGIVLHMERGEVKKWAAKKGKPLLDKILEIPGAKRFGEAAIGTNAGIRRFTKNMLFDEKMGGTIHLALGASYPETGGKNESPIHWDLLADMKEGGQIFADGELIYKNGKFLI